MHTYETALTLVGAEVPAHLDRQAPVPVLQGAQAQGDVLILPMTHEVPGEWRQVSSAGVRVVDGGSARNTHWLHRGVWSPDVAWLPAAQGVVLGYLRVPDGQTAQLVHTAEHGANGIGPGVYALHRKRQYDPRAKPRIAPRSAGDGWADWSLLED